MLLRYVPHQEWRTYYPRNVNLYGQTDPISYTCLGMPQLNSTPCPRSLHLYGAMAFNHWLMQEYKGLALSLGTAIKDHFIFWIPSRVCWGFHWDSIAVNFSLCLPLLSSLHFLAVFSQEPSLIDSLCTLSESAWLRTQPVAEDRKPGDKWRQLIHTLWNAASHLISLSLHFLIHWCTC